MNSSICFGAAFVFLLVFCHADETATSSSFTSVPWQSSTVTGYDFEAEIEFCQSSTSSAVFGYRLSSATPCGNLAPLIRMQAGKRYRLTLKNTAPASLATETNIHTHGLHISGDGNSDDITRHVEGGYCLVYNYSIPSDHADGTYWYHAHRHETTASQVSGGAFGLLIIDPTGTTASSRPASVSNWIANERMLLMSNADNGRRANGKTSEVVEITSNEWHYFRFANVDPAGSERSVVFDDSVCEVRMVAYDGVWRSSVPRPGTVSSFDLSGSSRADVAIRCTGASGIWYDVNSPRGDPIVELRISGAGSSAPSPWQDESTLTPWLPARPAYLQNNLAAPPGGDTYSIAMSGAQINGQSWDASTPITTMSFGTMQQWGVSGSGAHPFHLHLFHMQIATPGGCGGLYEEGEYFDTISGTTCVVRFKLIDIGGRMVMHCHVLGHEDNGAMTWIDVTGAPAASFSEDSPTLCSGNANPCGDCVPDQECGSSNGIDGCGNTCVATPGSCASGETCENGICVTSSNCAPNGSQCKSNGNCCSNVCTGRPKTCVAAR